MSKILVNLNLFTITMQWTKPKCSCSDQLGIVSFDKGVSCQKSKFAKEVTRKFFMGNNVTITTDDEEIAADHLLSRDHKDLADLLTKYDEGQLGAKFVPPTFFSSIPKLINLDEFKKKAELHTQQEVQKDVKKKAKKKENNYDYEKNLSSIKSHVSEKHVFEELKQYFEGNGDDVLVIKSHKFLSTTDEGKTMQNEKDFIIVNLSKGYIALVEVKFNASKVKEATYQILDGIEKVQTLFKRLGINPWKIIGICCYYTKKDDEKLPCDIHSDYVIGKDELEIKLGSIEKLLKMWRWNPQNHVEEFVRIAKNLLFTTQGSRPENALVTESRFIEETVHVVDQKAGTFENIWFWTPEQLGVVEALDQPYVLFDAFYSTGKTVCLIRKANQLWKNDKKNTIHFMFAGITKNSSPEADSVYLSYLKKIFENKTNVQVKSVNINLKFKRISIKDFLEKENIKPEDHLLIDEAKIYEGKLEFDGLVELTKHVNTCWVAIGHLDKKANVELPKNIKNSYLCPELKYPLRNALRIAQFAKSLPNKSIRSSSRLTRKIEIDRGTNITDGCLIIDEKVYQSPLDGLVAAATHIPYPKYAVICTEVQLQASTCIEYSKVRQEKLQSSGKTSKLEALVLVDPNEKELIRWLDTKKRDIIISDARKLQGFEADIVIYLHCACPDCGASIWLDPMVITRARAKLIMIKVNAKFHSMQGEKHFCPKNGQSTSFIENGRRRQANFKLKRKFKRGITKIENQDELKVRI